MQAGNCNTDLPAVCARLDKQVGMCYHRTCVKRNDRDSTGEFRYDREKVHRLKDLPKETFVNSLLSSLCERDPSSAGREVPLQTFECRMNACGIWVVPRRVSFVPWRDGVFFVLALIECKTIPKE